MEILGLQKDLFDAIKYSSAKNVKECLNKGG